MTEPSNNVDVKRRNRANTLRCILNCESISQPELARRLALSWPTVLQNVKELAAMGLVCEVGTYESTGGRKARAYAPVRSARLAVGLDVTLNHVGIVLVDLSGKVLDYSRKKYPFSMDDGYFRQLKSIVDEFAGGKTNLLGVGISLPGIINETGSILLFSHALGLRDIPTSTFSRYIEYPCAFTNDANAAAMAEVWGKDENENLVYLSLSNSVGGAIVKNGEIYLGDNLRAGEFGHNTLVPGGRQCYCGKDGCLDAYCSAKVLADRADGTIIGFFNWLRSGDAQAAEVWREYLQYLAVEINNLRMSFDCDVIVGGYVGGFLEEFGAPLREMLRQRNTFQPDDSYFRSSRYHLEASAVGAALLHVRRFIREI